ncbi:MAG: P-loop NTPase [Actinomycetota bacterium]|nr:P-loop NTPase [Actinomycetota bacterium]
MIFVADPQRAFHAHVGQSLVGEGLVHAESLAELTSLLGHYADNVDAVLLGPNFDQEEALGTAARLQAIVPNVGMVLVANDVTPELLHAALRSGMRDVLSAPFSPEQLRNALGRAEQFSRQLRGRGPGGSEGRGAPESRLVTVFSTKGGCGKSFVASNLAVLLAHPTGEEVALVDLDLQSGDLAIMLQVLPAWTIYDASESQDRLDAEALSGYLTPHQSGVRLLAAPTDPSLADAITPQAVHRILGILRQGFRYVVVDGPGLFTDQVLTALDESDVCVLVTSMDVPSIKNLKLALQTLEKLGLPRDRLRLLLNRADSNVGLRVSEVIKAIGTDIDVFVPSSRDVPLSINHGVPLALEKRKSPVVQPLAKLADSLRVGNQPHAAEATHHRGFLRRA